VNRRELLAGAVGVLGLGGGAWYAFGRGSGARVQPVTVETLDARGSTAGTMQVPVPGAVTVVDVFSVTCVPCRAELRRLNDVRGRLPDGVHLVSVTNDAIGGTLSRGDVTTWFERYGGHWPVALDDRAQLMRELSVGGLPTLVVDATGAVAWSHAGVVSDEALLSAVDGARG